MRKLTKTECDKNVADIFYYVVGMNDTETGSSLDLSF
jgi:hypothetical protein